MNAALRHHLHAAIHQRLVELHVGDAVHQQSPDPVFALEYRHLVPRLVELIRRSETRGAGADHRHTPAGAPLRRIVPYPSLGKPPVDDGVLDVLDGDRGIGDGEHAGALAGSGAGSAGELGEVVRLVEPVERRLPLAPVHQIVPFGDEVVDGTAGGGLAERNSAIHAPRPLAPQQRLIRIGKDLVEIADALRRVPIGNRASGKLQKT